MADQPIQTSSGAGASAEEPTKAFRVYVEDENSLVYKHYKAMRLNQSWEYVERMEKKWLTFDKARMSIRAAFDLLADYVDSSDPDASFPNVYHSAQAALGAKAAGKPDWLIFTALIHDLGKVMAKLGGTREDGQNADAASPQFGLGGDTWVVGLPIPDCAVLPQLNALNPDAGSSRFASPNGPYEPGCGIMALRYAFGHDEYIYRWALHNKPPLPREALAMLRLHSCYPLHRGGAYRDFFAPGDEALVAAINEFNEFDLYTKSESLPALEELWPYFQTLIDRFAPGELDW